MLQLPPLISHSCAQSVLNQFWSPFLLCTLHCQKNKKPSITGLNRTLSAAPPSSLQWQHKRLSLVAVRWGSRKYYAEEWKQESKSTFCFWSFLGNHSRKNSTSHVNSQTLHRTTGLDVFSLIITRRYVKIVAKKKKKEEQIYSVWMLIKKTLHRKHWVDHSIFRSQDLLPMLPN